MKAYILLTQQLKKGKKKSAKPNLDKLELDAKLNSELWLFGNAELFLLNATWRRSSTERNAAWQHFFKTRAVELVEKLTKLWQMYSLYSALALGGFGQFRICSTCGCGLRAPCAKRKIKKRHLTFKHISDAWWFHRGEGFRSWSNLGFQNLAAQKGWTAWHGVTMLGTTHFGLPSERLA